MKFFYVFNVKIKRLINTHFLLRKYQTEVVNLIMILPNVEAFKFQINAEYDKDHLCAINHIPHAHHVILMLLLFERVKGF